ncbi:MAG: heme-binding domain-containing protein [Chloroflexi bacterium]|nr:heme-binding domain-containing protein [Chloroflexota bacterium]
MKSTPITLAVALFFGAVVLLTFGGINLVAAPVWIVFRRGTNIATFNTVAQIASAVAIIILVAAAALIVIPLALEPAANWFRKSIKVLPAYLLGMTVAALLANLLSIATVGSLTSASSPIKLSLAIALLIVSAMGAIIAVTIAALRTGLSARISKFSLALSGISLGPILILCVAMFGAINIAMTTPTNLAGGGQSPAPQGAPPGGPGSANGIASLVTTFQMGGILMAVFAIVALVGVVIGVRALGGLTATASPVSIDYRREVGRAIVSTIAISIVLFVAMQLVPVARTNPPVVSTIQWDSPQTKALATRACMNCHSNETEWPLYAQFAPGSWITSVHVNSAREQFNLSELNKLPSLRRARLARDMAEQIRNNTMPPADFLLMHPEAHLTDAEKQLLIQGLQNSIK